MSKEWCRNELQRDRCDAYRKGFWKGQSCALLHLFVWNTFCFRLSFFDTYETSELCGYKTSDSWFPTRAIMCIFSADRESRNLARKSRCLFSVSGLIGNGHYRLAAPQPSWGGSVPAVTGKPTLLMQNGFKNCLYPVLMKVPLMFDGA